MILPKATHLGKWTEVSSLNSWNWGSIRNWGATPQTSQTLADELGEALGEGEGRTVGKPQELCAALGRGSAGGFRFPERGPLFTARDSVWCVKRSL